MSNTINNGDDSRQAAEEHMLAERMRRAIATTFARDHDLLRRGWLVNTCCLIEIGAAQIVLNIRDGRPAVADRVAVLASWDIAIRAGAETWAALWQPVPKAGWHDLFALTKRGAMRIEGSLQPFMANLQYFKDLVTLPRNEGQQ